MGRYWKKHPNKDLEKLLHDFDDAGWRIIDPVKRYYKVHCPCPDRHKRSIHISPSSPMYIKDARQWLQRQSCYKERRGE